MQNSVISSVLGKSTVLWKISSIFLHLSPSTWIWFGILLLVLWLVQNTSRSRVVRLIDKIPGPPYLPLLGNVLDVNVENDVLFERLITMRKLWGQKEGINRAWLGPKPYVFLSSAKTVEAVLSSSKHIDKSSEYDYLHPWLGDGLLTSSGTKWKHRRKMLTPAFHFKILEDFISVFGEQSALLVEKLGLEVNNGPFDLFPYVTLCTLDIICETAMGRKVGAQVDSDSEYVRAVYEIGRIIHTRQSTPWLQPDCLFRLSSHYKRHAECLRILHDFSERVIKERRIFLEEQAKLKRAHNTAEEDGSKVRLAFLDSLIEMKTEAGFPALTDTEIREEVDTFMFEGHDTTSAAICWSLYLIASDPLVQARVHQELDEIFDGEDSRCFPSLSDVARMKYLECCIKESLRLYPSVPSYARTLNEDVTIGDYLVPAGTAAIILTYALHRNEDVFPEPEAFRPERFHAAQSAGRHPYAYIPFSAGPRNCIGQKFAMLEEKIVLSSILRKYRLEAVGSREDITLLAELILRPKNGLKVNLYERFT